MPASRPRRAAPRGRNAGLAEGLEPRRLLSISPAAGGGVQRMREAVDAAPGEWVVKFDGDVAARQTDLARAVRTRRDDVQSVEPLGVAGLSLLRLPADVGYDELLGSLRGVRGFKYAEPNFRYSVDALPNDPLLPSLWGLHNTGQDGGTADADVDAPEAWDLLENPPPPGREVVVGVIDSGIKYDHPDLSANMWSNPGETAGNGVDDDANGFVDDVYGWDFVSTGDNDPFDDNGHGTHVAGTIAAAADNGIGVAGVGRGVRVMALKFISDDGSGDLADAVEAFAYAVAVREGGVNLRVLSNSWSGGGYSTALYDAIAAAGDAGILATASAGNGGGDAVGDDNDAAPRFPASYDLPHVVAVAATDRNDRRTPWSNFGRTSVDLGAPGLHVVSTVPVSAVGLSDPSGYRRASGTSMSAPHVSGAAALAFATAPRASVASVKAALLAGSDPLPSLAGLTVSGGRLNAAGTLRVLADSVAYTSPAEGEQVAAPPGVVLVGFVHPIDPRSLAPSDLLLNGRPADAVTRSPDGREAAFRFDADPPIGQGPCRMRFADGAVTRLSDGLPLRGAEWTFYHDVAPGYIVSVSPPNGSLVTTDPELPTAHFDVKFSEPVDPASVDADDLETPRRLDIDGDPYSVPARVTGADLTAPDTVRFTVDFQYDGYLELRINSSSIVDPFGNPAGAAGMAYAIDVGRVRLDSRLNPLDGLRASQLYGLSAPFPDGTLATLYQRLEAGGAKKRYLFPAAAGETFTAVATPTGDMTLVLTLEGPGGEVVATAAAAGPGRRAILQTTPLAAGGRYVLAVREANGIAGPITLEPYFNLNGLEREWYGDAADNATPNLAADLDPLMRPLPGGGERAAVRARGDASDSQRDYEPNDAAATATPVRSLRTAENPLYQIGLRASLGPAAGAGDEDWFNLGRLRSGTLSLAAAGAASARGTATDLRVRVFRHNGGNPLAVATSDPGPAGADARLRIVLPFQEDVYYAVIDGRSGGGYDLGLLLERSPTAPGSGEGVTAEVEPNDTAAAANDLSRAWRRVTGMVVRPGGLSSTPHQRTGTPGDVDYALHHFHAGDLVTVLLTPGSGTWGPEPVTFALRGQDNAVLARADTSGAAGAAAAFPIYGFVVPSTGFYYFDVRSAGFSRYQAGVYVSSTQPPPRLGPYGGTLDYYKLSLAKGQEATLIVNGEDDRMLFDVAILDAGGRTLFQNSAGPTHGYVPFRFSAPATAVYYLSVRAADFKAYTLLALRDADIESHTGPTSGAVVDLSRRRSGLGEMGTTFPPDRREDTYRFFARAGTTIRLATHTPGDGVGGRNTLDTLLELHGPGGLLAADDNSAPDGRNARITFVAPADGQYVARVRHVRGGGDYVLSKQTSSVVVARRVFYNNSAFDGNDPAANANDDFALAPDKTALLPGRTATAANYTSYSRGLNGVIVDLASLPAGAVLSADDFAFRAGNGPDPASWAAAPPPAAVAVRVMPSADGVGRVTLTWPDGAIRNQWLQVTVKANANTGLASPDVFYFGHAAGDTVDGQTTFVVNSLDVAATRARQFQAADVTSRFDHDRNGTLDAEDVAMSRANQFFTLHRLAAPAAFRGTAILAVSRSVSTVRAAVPPRSALFETLDEESWRHPLG